MKNLLKSIATISLMTFAALTVSSVSQAESMTPKDVERIDVQQYMGKWYEIAHLPMYFQRKCVGDTTARYSLNADQSITVLNSCRTATGKMDTAEGIAYAKNAGNSQLKVSFLPKGLRWLPFTKGDYWVLRIDPEYKVALVGGPSNKYLWILSKTPNLDQATYQSYLETARQYGYDISKVVKTPQSR